MAVVWKAYDSNLDRLVAVKEPLIPPGIDSATAAEMGARFVREGKAAGKLNHPNIITIYNADIYGGRPAIVMEIIEGRTLSDVIDSGRLTIEAAVSIVDQLLDAVGFAHARGVVHRDIKPDNVFVTDDGRVKLTDFGIASVSTAGTLTQAGQVLGTPGYMAPEQVIGGAVDGRADIFAVGVIAYELLTGRNPFGATDGQPPTTILYRVVHEEPPAIPEISAEVPAHLAAIVSRAMAKEPEQRYRTAEDMRSDLRNAVFTPSSALPAASIAAPRLGRNKTSVAVAVALVLVLGTFGLVFFRGGQPFTTAQGGAPTLAVTSPTEGQQLKLGDSLQVKVEPGPGVRRVTVLVNGDQVGVLETAPFEVSYTPPKEGNYEIKAVAEGGSGARSDVSRTISVVSGVASGGTSLPSSGFDANQTKRDVEQAVDDWLSAWEAMDFGRYMSFYAPDFRADYKGAEGRNLDAWRAYKQGVFAQYSYQHITVTERDVRADSADHATVVFMQKFESNSTRGAGSYSDYGRKTMTWIKSGGRWLISQEEWVKY